MKTIRQGDVLLQQVAELPKGALRKVKPELPGRIVLAHGEVTGHHHSLAAGHAALLETDTGERYLAIHGAPPEGAPLEHQEHSPHFLQENEIYRVLRQREFAPEAPSLSRNVVD